MSTEKPGLSEGAAMLALFTLAIACALLLLWLPRSLAPVELPGLRLPRASVAAVVADDERAAKAAPASASALELERLFLEHGEAEDRLVEATEQIVRRKHALRDAYQRLLQEQGQAATLVMRARALAKLEAALDLKLPEEQLKGVLGVFPSALQVYGVTSQGDELAPHFVLRTLYKVRWNLAMSQAPDLALGWVEKLAYHGWLALHAQQLQGIARITSLDKYAANGGKNAVEAHGELLFLSQQYGLANAALEAAYASTGNLRLRNYALGAALAAAQENPRKN